MHRKKMCGNCLEKKFEYEFPKAQWRLPFGRKRWCRECYKKRNILYNLSGLTQWIRGCGPERDWTLSEMKLGVMGRR
jgi:hypothetical protein